MMQSLIKSVIARVATKRALAFAAASALLAASLPALAVDPSAEGDDLLAPPTFSLPGAPPTDGDRSSKPKAGVGEEPPLGSPPGFGSHGGLSNSEKQAGPAAKAQPAPSSPEQRDKLLAELYDRLSAAPDADSAAPIALAIEQLWNYSGSATADLLVQRATMLAQSNRQDLAMKLLTTVVELQPDYAEAWNRRAFLYYLMDDTQRALGDIRRVLALEPKHYKALEGLANILENNGDKKNALKAYDSLLKVYPNMPGAKASRDELLRAVEGQGI
ncbi:MAG: tetratricopeptide repeat protein [Hyphomicrobium sp.]|jgi:tetratricopeptide (TPR) repeat protein